MNEIYDVKTNKLNQIIDERGGVYKYLDSCSSNYKGFGEAYFSKINENTIKGWKLHLKVHQNFCVPFGKIKIVLFDNRQESISNGTFVEYILDDNENYKLLSIPPGLWYSFKCISKHFALLSNITNEPHNKNESITLPLNNNQIPYKWD